MIGMNIFKEEFEKDLIEIDKKLQLETDVDVIKQLLKDKKYIINVLNPKRTKASFEYMNKENKEDMLKIIQSSQIYFRPLKQIRCTKNNTQILNLFKKFLDEDIFNLKCIYQKIISYNGIKYLDDSNCYGSTTYITSLNKNYIQIAKTKNIFEYTTLVHELGHSKINFIGNKFCVDRKESIYGEAYSIFLELIFSNFLKDNNLLKESYEIKNLIFRQTNDFSRELNDEYYDYLEYSDEQSFNRFIFEFKYKYFKNILLALQFYYMYKANVDLTIQKIKYFIDNIYKVTDNELLSVIKIDMSDFNNENINKLYNELVEEKGKIKRKIL